VFVCLVDLTDEQSFRDLSKPIGALTTERLERLHVRLFCLLQHLVEFRINKVFMAHKRVLLFRSLASIKQINVVGDYLMENEECRSYSRRFGEWLHTVKGPNIMWRTQEIN